MVFDDTVEQILKESQFTGPIGFASDVMGSAGNVIKRFMNTELYQIASGLDPTRISAMPNAVNKGYEFIKRPNVFSAATFLISLLGASPVGGQVIQALRAPNVALKMLQLPFIVGSVIQNKRSIMSLIQREQGSDMQQSFNSAMAMLNGAKPKIDQQAQQLKMELDKQRM